MDSNFAKIFKKLIIQKSNNGEDFITKSGLSRKEIRLKLKVLPFQVHPEIIDLYLAHNGFYTDGYIFPLLGLVSVIDFDIAINDALTFKDKIDDFDDLEDKILHNDYFPVLSDGAGDVYWLNCNKDDINYRKLLLFTNSGSYPHYEFNSLKQYIESVLTAYEEGIVLPYEEGSWLVDYDYDEFKKITRSY